jgi:hypothetical protein
VSKTRKQRMAEFAEQLFGVQKASADEEPRSLVLESSKSSRKSSIPKSFAPSNLPEHHFQVPLVDFIHLNLELRGSLDYHVVHDDLHKVDWEKISFDEMKMICRDGLTHTVRGKVWELTTKTRECMEVEKLLFDNLNKETFRHYSIEDLPEVHLFGHSGNLERHCLTPQGKNALHRVVLLLQRKHFDVDFCPFIPELISVLFCYCSEKHSFYVIHSIVKKSLREPWYLPVSGSQFASFLETVKQLAVTRLPRLVEHLKKVKAFDSVFDVIKAKFMSGLFSCFPRYTALRILDAFFCEGIKVLYRIALAILQIHEEEFTQEQSSMECVHLAKNIMESCHDGQELIRAAFRLQLSRKEIFELESSVSKSLNPALIPKIKRAVFDWPIFDPSLSEMLTKRNVFQLWMWIPSHLHTQTIYKAYTTQDSGYSLQTFIKKVEKLGALLIVIKTIPYHSGDSKENKEEVDASNDDVDVFGVFISEDFKANSRSVVDKMMFVFRRDETSKDLIRYPQREDVPENEIFYTASHRYIAITGGG